MTDEPRNTSPSFFVSGVGANNGGSAKINFENRKAYRTEVFNDDLISNAAYTWGKDRFYGKLNTKGEAVLPRRAFLKPLRYTVENDTYLALNFVADAWRDLAERLRKLRDQNIIYEESPWSAPQIHKAYQDPYDIYSTYMKDQVFGVFVNYYLSRSSPTRKKVKDFDTFLSEFTPFFDRVISKTGFLTYSGMVESGWTTPLVSGLIIELATEDYDSDRNKTAKFGDFNFGLVADIAAQYGFKIDRNVPWRFVADLSSKAMQEYMIGVPITGIDGDFQNKLAQCAEVMQRDPGYIPDFFGYSQIPGFENVKRHISAHINSEGELTPGYSIYQDVRDARDQQGVAEVVFSYGYRATRAQDISSITPYLRNMYNSYVNTNPVVMEYSPSPYASRGNPLGILCPSVVKTTRLLFIDDQTIGSTTSRYQYRWAYKFFYNVRTKERNKGYSIDEIRRHLQETTNRYDFGGGSAYRRYSDSLKYIHENFIGPFQTKFLNIETISDILEEGENSALSDPRRQDGMRGNLY
jgi:hypothetical protein